MIQRLQGRKTRHTMSYYTEKMPKRLQNNVRRSYGMLRTRYYPKKLIGMFRTPEIWIVWGVNL